MSVLFIYLVGFSVISSTLTADTDPLKSGEECECSGVKGTCVVPTKCLTSLDTTDNKSCSACKKIGWEDAICCTDCNLVNDTRNAVLSPYGDKILWKDGGKAKDHCLEFISSLPYQCKDGIQSGLLRDYDATKQCHNYKLWTKNVLNTASDRTIKYPFQVRLGFVQYRRTLTWSDSGTIISEKFVVTDASTVTKEKYKGLLKYVSTSIKSYKDSFLKWSVYRVVRIIVHPGYKDNYNSIALVETEPMKFNANLLPACLPFNVPALNDVKLISAYVSPYELGEITERNVEIYSEDLCSRNVPSDSYLKDGYNHTTHICGIYKQKDWKCIAYSGEPLMVRNDVSPCVNTLVGFVSFCVNSAETQGFTRVSAFVPWIESYVWP